MSGSTISTAVPTISRDELYWSLARAAQLRSVVTLLAFLPVSVSLMLLLPKAIVDFPWSGPLILSGSLLLTGYLFTLLGCRRMVRCPHCNASLWSCGTGNFKARRMRVREDALECPGCGAAIVQSEQSLGLCSAPRRLSGQK